jgi:hypothetical protein
LAVVLHQLEYNTHKIQRLLFDVLSFLPDAEHTYLAGDQLQRDVQHWLSPPDPSTNHDLVWKAHHEGTATWLFESDVLASWKLAGSLLWIHGKRTFLNHERALALMDSYSGFGEKYSPVCNILICVFDVIHIAN